MAHGRRIQDGLKHVHRKSANVHFEKVDAVAEASARAVEGNTSKVGEPGHQRRPAERLAQPTLNKD